MALDVRNIHTAACFFALESYFTSTHEKKRKRKELIENVEIPWFDTFVEADASPFFVTWEKRGRLRGCIGTLRTLPHVELKSFSLKSALEDMRFDPVILRELPLLSVSVSILHSYEDASNWEDWEVGKHGLVITLERYSATYLPEVAQEQQWNHRETIESLLQKAGYKGVCNEHILTCVHVTRYQSAKAKMSYQEYQEFLQLQ